MFKPLFSNFIKTSGSLNQYLGFVIQVLTLLSFSQTNLLAQATTVDGKYHNVGMVKQLVTNMGPLWPVDGIIVPDYTYNSEYPVGSTEEHIGEAGIWVGAINSFNDTLVSVTCSWAPHVSECSNCWEFYPGAEETDSIWVVGKGDTVDIPFWEGGYYRNTGNANQYVGLSDQDFVAKFNDYNLLTPYNHYPLYVDVVQTTYAWGNSLMDDFIIFTYYIIPKRKLKDIYIAYFSTPRIGGRLPGESLSNVNADDYTVYYPDLHMVASADGPGGTDGDTYSPIGFMFVPSKDIPEDSLTWTFNWGPQGAPGIMSPNDNEKYRDLMITGEIMQNQQSYIGTHFVISFGPFNVEVDDTIMFRIGLVFGDGFEGEGSMLENAMRLKGLIENDFSMPSAPPTPTMEITTSNHSVTIKWDANKEIVEEYVDPYRGDAAAVPFEGYRLYKSTYSLNGPWTLLAEYDIPDNSFFENIGLEYEYTDIGLLNNVEYYYTVSAFSKPDTAIFYPSLESSLNGNAIIVIPGVAIQETVGKVAAVPNPYLGSIDYSAYNPSWEKPPPNRPWLEQDRRLQFINLPANSIIKIYTSAGDLVETIKHNDPDKGYEDWDMTSYAVQAIASGIYLFTVEDTQTGKVQVGKFVVIK